MDFVCLSIYTLLLPSTLTGHPHSKMLMDNKYEAALHWIPTKIKINNKKMLTLSISSFMSVFVKVLLWEVSSFKFISCCFKSVFILTYISLLQLSRTLIGFRQPP